MENQITCLGCNNSFEPIFGERYFCLKCQNKKMLYNRLYKRFRVMQIVSKKDIPECCICGRKDIRVLSLNRIKTKIKKIISDGDLYNKIIFNKMKTDIFEVRCFNCNILYKWEIGKFKKNNKLKEEVMNILSNYSIECINCKEKDIRILDVNHLYRNILRKDRRQYTIYKGILNGENADNLDIRCRNCNILYEYERKDNFNPLLFEFIKFLNPKIKR